MKKVTYLLALIIFFATNLSAQEQDSLIQLYPGLGDTVDSFNASYFELFQNIDGFEQAVFYIRNNQRLISKVTFSENGKTNDTTFIQPLSALYDVRKNIEEIEKENEKKYESPREFIIETKNGSKYLCEIEMFSKNEIYFSTEEKLFSDTYNTSKFKMNFSNVEILTLVGKTYTWSCLGYGALIVAGVTLIAALATNAESYAIFGAGFGAVIGAIFGLVVGLISSTGDVAYPIDFQADLLQLKPSVKYFFKYNESLEKQYVQVK